MSSQQYLDALASERSHNRRLLGLNLTLAVVAVIGMALLWAQPRQLDLHLNPDLRAGERVSVNHGTAPIPNPNVYSCAYYVWQQVNRWQADGHADYGKQIYDFQPYLTPRCQAQLQADMEMRNRAGELRMRTRQIGEIPGLGFADNRVIGEGPSAWTVLLDMQVQETFRGQAIKDTFVRYPVRVVRYDVDRQRNPFKLAVDCFGNNRPARIDVRDSAISGAPGTGVSPAVLPAVSNETVSAAVPGAQANSSDSAQTVAPPTAGPTAPSTSGPVAQP